MTMDKEKKPTYCREEEIALSKLRTRREEQKKNNNIKERTLTLGGNTILTRIKDGMDIIIGIGGGASDFLFGNFSFCCNNQ